MSSAFEFADATWPQTTLILGILALILFFTMAGFATLHEFRKLKMTAAQEDQLRQLVQRYEQLAEKSLDAQQRIAADLAELRSRTSAVEQILRTVE